MPTPNNPDVFDTNSPSQPDPREDFAPGELDALIEVGERSGPPLDGQEVLTELRTLRNAHRTDE